MIQNKSQTFKLLVYCCPLRFVFIQYLTEEMDMKHDADDWTLTFQ